MRSRLVAAFVAFGLLAGAACGSSPSAPPAEADRATSTTGTGEATTSSAPSATTVPDAPSRLALPDELRAAWIHLFDDTLKSRAGIRDVVAKASAANLNALFVQVMRRHDAYYSSSILPRTPDPALPSDLDVLEAVIEEAGKQGIQVHAWIVLAPVYHAQYDALTMPADHVYVQHGPTSDDTWMTIDADGKVHDSYLDLALPEVQDHVAAVVREITSRYAVDGIHTDYIRYDGPQYGYHPRVLAQYRSETGAQGTPAPEDAAWTAWRRGRIDALAERVATEARAARPGIAVSAAVIAQRGGPASVGGFEGTVAYSEKFQNWPQWLDDGHLDLAVPMAYFREADAQQHQWFREWVAFAAELGDRSDGRKVAVGLGAWLNTVPASLTQAEAALEVSDGIAVFSYQQDSSDERRGALLDALRRGPFAD